jgi:ferredoxin/flavodoxin---NADP+ reductase
MAKIITKQQLNQSTIMMEIEAPRIAAKAKAGQFIIFRLNEHSERVPLTISNTDQAKGLVRIIFQTIGKSTSALGQLNEQDDIMDFVGPLGHACDFSGVNRLCIVVGGLGSAIGFMSAKQAFLAGIDVDIVVGFKSQELIILEAEMKQFSSNTYVCTDDGSYGFSGFVTQRLEELLQSKSYDLVLTIGPLPMMKNVVNTLKPYGIKVLASLNPIMVDGSGMCGGCRVRVGNEMRFACVDGPEFDGNLIDFDELIQRNRFYQQQEKAQLAHFCQLTNEVRK